MKRLTAMLLFLVAPLQAAAPPAFKCDNGGFSATTSCGCNLTGVASGSFVAIGFYAQSTTISGVGITDGGGGNTWHIIGPINGSGNSSFIGWTVATNSFGSFQWNWTGSTTGDCFGARYTNMASAGTVADCNSAGSSGNGTALASGSCTPTAANDVLVAIGGVLANSATMSAGGSFTVEQSNAHSSQGNSYGWEDENSSSCSSQQATATESVTGQWSMIMAAFKTSAPTSCTSGGGAQMMKMERYE
jgi:hypothetical protein